MKRLVLPALLIATAEVFAEYRDPMGASSDYSSSSSIYSSTERYFGGNDPAVVAPIPPGQGTSYYSRDQVMTDHQSCYRSAATGAWVCQGH